MSISNNPVASGSAFTLDMGKDSVTGNLVQKVALTEPGAGAFVVPMQQTGGSVTALSSGAITNPTSVLTRPSSAVSAAVTFTSPNFTWTGNPLVNGQTVTLAGTMPTNFTAGAAYYVVNVSGNNFQLSLTLGGAAITGTGGSGLTATLVYVAPEFIGSATSGSSAVAPSFAIATSAGGVLIARVRLWTNVTSGWGTGVLSVNLWTAAPSYAAANGDGQPYNPSGAQNWLANFIVPLVQYADGAAGAGVLTAGNAMSLKLASGTSVFWDLSVASGSGSLTPVASQTFNLAAELQN